jgi:hypothetical protein
LKGLASLLLSASSYLYKYLGILEFEWLYTLRAVYICKYRAVTDSSDVVSLFHWKHPRILLNALSDILTKAHCIRAPVQA